jgi:hypothetical protein
MKLRFSAVWGLFACGAVLVAGCHEREPSPAAFAALSASPLPVDGGVGSVSAPSPVSEPPPVTAIYPWEPHASERLDARFATPGGFVRVDEARGSFGAFLRTLPLLPEGTPVVDYRGSPLYDGGHHPHIAAVVDLDIGHADLQHCADVVVRLHAEWRYGRGERDISYRSASGTVIPYRRYVAGERVIAQSGNALGFIKRGARTDDHVLFRSYLDDVFTWVNTRSLERDGSRVALADLRPGDFFVVSGSPFGHAVLVLDVARDERNRLALLLGQGYMPAQSFHVLRASERQAWFIVEPGAASVATPFWPAFPVDALRRL